MEGLDSMGVEVRTEALGSRGLCECGRLLASLGLLCFPGREAGGTVVRSMGSGLRLPLSGCVSLENLFEPQCVHL